MAFKMPDLSNVLSKIRKPGKASLDVPTISSPTLIDQLQTEEDDFWTQKLPIIGHLPHATQRDILSRIIWVLVLIAGLLAWQDFRKTQHGTAYVAATGQMRMLSQRLAKDGAQALQGRAEAFPELGASRDTFTSLTNKLNVGGEIEGIEIPGSPDSTMPALQSLQAAWDKSLANASQLLAQEKALTNLGKSVDRVNAANGQMLELTEQLAATRPAASTLSMLSQRIAKNANNIRASDSVDPDAALQLSKDLKTFGDTMSSLRNTVSENERAKLTALDSMFGDYQTSINGVLSNIQNLSLAKVAGSQLVKESSGLLAATDGLVEAYKDAEDIHLWLRGGIILIAWLVITLLVILTRVTREDTERRRVDAERREEEAKRDKENSQAAILRLMNEMGDLADGDLTIRATVSEDITGAIADSVNYTVEELAVLVRRINEAAIRVAGATETAQRSSAELLDTSKQQVMRLQEAGQSAMSMADSMNNMSVDAQRSAQVARQSLNAAQNGSVAVQNSIRGMNEIRDYIQETSKRIKRLGESSQEIGEIVELISDITEQTNVLALNAAIQAASAGEAGRGFTVVAEEVQRLAERSAEATKQIAAIVKTIQTDTGDAVAAMESSTRGVVEGARLSDAAGQALSEISQVSNQLAELIQNMSGSSERQAQTATQVAEVMRAVLQMTEEGTRSTEQTAQSIGALNELAVELKGSVSGFKV